MTLGTGRIVEKGSKRYEVLSVSKPWILEFIDLCHYLQIENLHNDTPQEYENYVKPDPDSHGKHGYAISRLECQRGT